MEDDGTTPRRPRRHPILLTFALLIALSAAAIFIIGPRDLLARALAMALDRAGLGPATVAVSHLGWDGLELSDLTAGRSQALRINRVRISTSRTGFLPGLERIEVSGVRARLTWSDGTLRLGSRDLLAGETGAGASHGRPIVPTAFRVTDAVVTVEGAELRLRAATEGVVALSPAGGAGAVTLHVQSTGTPSAIEPHTGRLDLRIDANANIEARLALAPEAEGKGRRVRLSGWAGANGDGSVLGGHVDIAAAQLPPEDVDLRGVSLAFLRTPALADPLVALRSYEVGSNASIAITVSGVQAVGRLQTRGGAKALALAGCVELDEVAGTLVWVKHLRICPDPSGAPLIASDQGGKRLRLAASVLSARMAVREKGGGAEMVRGQSPTFDLAGILTGDDWSGTLSASGGDFSLQGRVIRLTDLALTGKLAGQGNTVGSGELTLSNAFVKDWTPEPLFAPLVFTGGGTVAENRVEMNASAKRDSGGEIASAVLTHDLATRLGRIDLTLVPQRFAPEALQPATLMPFLKGRVTQASGEVSGTAWYTWTPDRVMSGARMKISSLGFTTGLGRLEEVAGDVALASLTPLRTGKPQTIRVGLMDLGVPLPNGLLTFTIAPDRTLQVHEATWSFLDGTVGLASGQFGTGDRQTATFAVSHVNLEKLLALIDIDGLTGTGFLSGTVPVTMVPGAQNIAGGEIAAEGPGLLSYKTSSAVGTSTEGGDSSNILYKALDNFHYDALSATLDGNISGDLSLAIHLKGSNPDLYNGYPIELNVSTAGPFVSMVRKGIYRYEPSSAP